MIELVAKPSESSIRRLELAVDWAYRLYGSKSSRRMRIVAELPEAVSYRASGEVGSSRTHLTYHYTPAVQFDGSTLRVHPLLCRDSVPRFVLRYVVAWGLMRATTFSPRLLELKSQLTPYRKSASKWLDVRGFGEDQWDI